MKKIDELTPEQEAKVPFYLKKWLDNGRKTTRLDQDKAKQAIIDIYECAGLEPPTKFMFFPSPIQCQLAANLMKPKEFGELVKSGNNLANNLLNNLENNLTNNLWNNLENNLENNLANNLWNNLTNNLKNNLLNNLTNNLKNNLENNLRNNLWNNLENNLTNNLWNNLENNLRNNLLNNLTNNLKNNLENSLELKYEYIFFGNHWIWWVGFYDFVLNELFQNKVKEYRDFTKYLSALQQVHIFIPYADIVFVSDNPEYITLDASGRLHGETAPAMMYPDGYSLFYMNGVQVPKWSIETPKEEISPKQVLELANTEQRAVLMRFLGLAKFLKELKAEKLDEYNGYRLYYLNIESQKIGPYLYMKCPSSGREFLEGVGDPNPSMIDGTIKTCQDALKWRSIKASKNLMTKFNLTWSYKA